MIWSACAAARARCSSVLTVQVSTDEQRASAAAHADQIIYEKPTV